MLNPAEDDARLVRESGFFDEDYYRHFRPDLPEDRDVVKHFIRFGGREGLDPSEKFSTSGYLRQNPDVAKTHWNPLVHYLRHGRTEGRIAPRGALREPYVDALHAERWQSIQPMPVTRMPAGERRISIVTDSVAPHSLFGGVGTAIILGVQLANRLGNGTLRLVTRTDMPDGQVISLLEEATGIHLDGILELEQVSTDGSQRLQYSDRDIVMTTSWWTTRAVLDSDIPREQVLYLLQEDERMFYAYGDERLLCQETLAEPDLAVVVNTSRLLRAPLRPGRPPPPARDRDRARAGLPDAGRLRRARRVRRRQAQPVLLLPPAQRPQPVLARRPGDRPRRGGSGSSTPTSGTSTSSDAARPTSRCRATCTSTSSRAWAGPTTRSSSPRWTPHWC